MNSLLRAWSLDIFSCKSHQRSWWIVHTRPTQAIAPGSSQIPTTQLVDRSYSAYFAANNRSFRNLNGLARSRL